MRYKIHLIAFLLILIIILSVSAEQIIHGELSSIWDEFVLNVKVIDVTTGMNICR